MIDKKTISNCGAGVNIDTRDGMSMLGHNPRQQRDSLQVQLVRQPENRNCKDRRISEDHFIDALGRRIAVVRRLHIDG